MHRHRVPKGQGLGPFRSPAECAATTPACLPALAPSALHLNDAARARRRAAAAAAAEDDATAPADQEVPAAGCALGSQPRGRAGREWRHVCLGDGDRG